MKNIFVVFFFACCSTILLSGCFRKTYTPEEYAANAKKLNQFLDSLFDDVVDHHPNYQTVLGIKKDAGKWTPCNDAFQLKEIDAVKRNLMALQSRFHLNELEGQARISYLMFVQESKEKMESFAFRYHNYPLNQMEGYHTSMPSLLMNMQPLENLRDANNYISRLKGFSSFFEDLLVQLRIREEKGIIPPLFVFPKVKSDCENLLTGFPFTAGETASPLYENFRDKLNACDSIPDEMKKSLLADAKKALIDSVQPAYKNLLAYWDSLGKKADTTDGCWKWPMGNEYYHMALRHTTTLNLSPDSIHQTGLSEVARIHREMEEIKKKVGFTGSLREFFDAMRNNQTFYYPNTEEGKKSYLHDTHVLIDAITNKLDALFVTKPKAKLVVKPVEEFREKTAGGAFYEEPAPDGSRPGRYYINLYTLSDQPKYQMEALAYHEAIPGHHMQIAIAQELKDLPKFRKLGGNTAYVEGWALYAELVPKEIGFYTDPYSDFGRLSMEVFRASRLVIDTGIHFKKWTKKQALAYMLNNTPNPVGDSEKEIERYIVWPSQATGYKIGMLSILSLREKCKKELGNKFNIREFHDMVLKNGSVPLELLNKIADEYISSKKADA